MSPQLEIQLVAGVVAVACALPGVFLATDGLFETFLTVLDELGVYPAVVQRELDRYLPFLATTAVLVAAVQNGVDPPVQPGQHMRRRGRRNPTRRR